MTTQIQRRRGTTAQHSTFTGAVGEVTVDTDKEVLVVHDGAQAGGYPQMRENGSNSALALGSATTPSLKFAGDTNTGIYSPGADQVAISSNGVGRLFIDASGNVGVGEAAPGEKLVVAGSISSGGRGTAFGYKVPDWRIYNSSSGNALVFDNYTTEYMRLDSSGRLGLGTSSPRSLLNVAVNSSAGSILTLENTNTAPDAGWYLGRLQFYGNDASTNASGVRASIDAAVTSAGATTDIVFSNTTFLDSTLYERMRITAQGNVGIGVNAPTNALTIRASSDDGIALTRPSNPAATHLLISTTESGGDAYSVKYETGNNNQIFSTSTAGGTGGNIIFRTSTSAPSVERGRWDSSGRFLVGTSSSASAGNSQYSLLQVRGNSLNTSAIFSLQSTNAAASISPDSVLGSIEFADSAGNSFAHIQGLSDATPGASDYPGRLVFSVTSDGSASPTEALRITNDRYVRLASGTGGIQFNGDTAAANALDDYEEGTWTPSLTASTSGTITASAAVGRYVKVGRLVTLVGYVTVSSVSSPTGDLNLAGLPFPQASDSGGSGSIHSYNLLTTVPFTSIGILQLAGLSYVAIRGINNGSQVTSMANNIQANAGINFSISYFA